MLTGPLTMTARGDDPGRVVRRLASASAVATLLLIAAGGAVRATDSGLACPDWPACYGQWIPPADLHMWLEHSHRLWAGVVGLLILALAVAAFSRRRAAPALWRLSLLALALVIVQAGLGAAVVLLHLRAGLVTSHLTMSFVIVGALVVVAVMARQPDDVPAAPSIGRWSVALAVLVLAQAALGSHATGRGAAYVFNAVPIWLSTDTWSGHVRELLHVTHRAGGYLVAAAVVAFAVALRRARVPHRLQRLAWLSVGLVGVQVLLGLGNVLTQAAVPIAIGHLAVASWLWAAVVLTGALAASTPALSPSGTAPDRQEVHA